MEKSQINAKDAKGHILPPRECDVLTFENTQWMQVNAKDAKKAYITLTECGVRLPAVVTLHGGVPISQGSHVPLVRGS